MRFLLRRCGWVLLVLCAVAGAAVLVGPVRPEWPTSRQPLFDAQRPIDTGTGAPWPITLESGLLERIDLALVREEPVDGRISVRLTRDVTGERELTRAAMPAAAAEYLSQAVRRPYGYVPFRFTPAVAADRGPAWLWLEADSDGTVAARCLLGNGIPRLAMKTFYQTSMRENVALLLARLVEGRHDVLGSVWLYVALLAAYVVLVAGIASLVGCGRDRDGQDGQDRIE